MSDVTIPELQAPRILVCVENQSLCDFTRSLLEKDGYAVKTVNDPTLAEGEVRGGSYRVIVLDHAMTKLDGVETLRRVRTADPDLPAVMFTSNVAIDAVVAAMKLVRVETLRKPVTSDALGEAVDRAVQGPGSTRTAEEQVHRAVGNRLRKLRKDRGLTLKNLARLTGLSVAQLSQIERAETSASISSLYKITTALESRIGELFGEY